MIIPLYKFLYESFFEPSHLWKAAEFKRKKAVQLFFLLSFLIGIPFFTEGFSGFSRITQDIERVADRIPAFVIQDGRLETAEPLDKALVVRTDSMNLIFDLDNQYEKRQEQKDLKNAQVNLLFKEKTFTILINEMPITVSYANAEGLTDQFFRSMLLRINSRNILAIVLLIVFSLLIGMLESVIRLLLLSFLANILSAFRGLRLPFSANWKMMMGASFVPTLFFAALNAFSIYPAVQDGAIALVSGYLYYQAIKKMMNKLS